MSLKVSLSFHISYINFVNICTYIQGTWEKVAEVKWEKTGKLYRHFNRGCGDIEIIGRNIIATHVMEGGWQLKSCSTMIPHTHSLQP